MNATDGSGQPPSKTEKKRQMHALQTLGERLVRLNREQFARLDLPDELREAVEFAHRITSHEARRRHMQYLGKLMRQVDADQVRAGLEQVTGESRAAVMLMHRAEAWRDRLLEDDAALTSFVAENPDADVQWLRNTIRTARREHERIAAAGSHGHGATPAPKHARELYRHLHQLLTKR